jgi:hypothetical protein
MPTFGYINLMWHLYVGFGWYLASLDLSSSIYPATTIQAVISMQVMNTILQKLQKYRQKRSVRLLLSPVEEQHKLLPNLPIEIWLIILQMVIRPSLIIDLDFLPFEIERAQLCLNAIHGGERAAQQMVWKSKCRLRAVCHTWKEMVDHLDLPSHWVRNVPYRKGIPPPSTHQHQRLIQYQSLPFGSRINGAYSHPVSNLSVVVDVCDFIYRGPLYATSLAEFTSFPGHLRVLNLHLYECRASKDVLKDIEAGQIPLTTLGLTVRWTDILQTSLEIPTLTSLFMTIPRFDETLWSEHPSHFQWRFPNLRNLSWTESRQDGLHNLYNGHPLFLGILRDHFDLIASLRMFPMSRETVNVESLLCWSKMAKLQALAVNFAQMEENELKFDTKNSMTAVKSDSVRYLVNLDAALVNPHKVVDGLEKAIDLCNKLQVVNLTGPPEIYKRDGWKNFLRSRPYHWWDTGAIQRLQKLCNKCCIRGTCEEGWLF